MKIAIRLDPLSAPIDSFMGRTMRSALASKGQEGYWEKILEFSQAEINAPEGYHNSHGAAILYTRLGKNDRAIGLLEQALTQHRLSMTGIAIEPAFDSLKSNARFLTVLRQVGVTRPQ